MVGTRHDKYYNEKILGLISKHNLSEKCTLTGRRNQILKYFAGSDIYIFLSKSDPHPRSVLEAMASGLPVVAYNIDGVAESIENNISGYLINNGNTYQVSKILVKLLKDANLRKKIGKNAQEHVKKHFKSSITAKKIDRVIRGIFN